MAAKYVIKHPEGERYRTFGGWTADAEGAMQFTTQGAAEEYLGSKIGQVVMVQGAPEGFVGRSSQGAQADYDPFGLSRR